ncbi:MAG: DUF3037 domain-containing protein [Candidatus Dormibacteria bacterium]
MSRREPFAYAVLRVVPDLQRGEGINAAVVLYCRGHGFLGLLSGVPGEKLRALDRTVDLEGVAAHLRSLELIAAGDPGGGPIAAGPQSSRFHWLVAPTSTIVQPSAVHTGLCLVPGETLHRLFQKLVG